MQTFVISESNQTQPIFLIYVVNFDKSFAELII